MRQRWVATPTGLVPADEYYAKKHAERTGSFTVMPDLKPFISPIDGKEITSRSGLREHEKRHNVFQIGSDLKPADYNAAPKRQNQFNDRAFDAAFGKAVQKLGL